jgi:hypothetical protein
MSHLRFERILEPFTRATKLATDVKPPFEVDTMGTSQP